MVFGHHIELIRAEQMFASDVAESGNRDPFDFGVGWKMGLKKHYNK